MCVTDIQLRNRTVHSGFVFHSITQLTVWVLQGFCLMPFSSLTHKQHSVYAYMGDRLSMCAFGGVSLSFSILTAHERETHSVSYSFK